MPLDSVDRDNMTNVEQMLANRFSPLTGMYMFGDFPSNLNQYMDGGARPEQKALNVSSLSHCLVPIPQGVMLTP